jgi:hypothetical protein
MRFMLEAMPHLQKTNATAIADRQYIANEAPPQTNES